MIGPMQEPALRHRLLAILAADAAGFSRLMAADERATVAALDAARDVFRAAIAAHGGRLVDTAGDSVLAVFDTATGALVAALAVQAGLDQGLRFRIGLHLGDVFEKPDGTVYGDGVNIAARLQTLAEPGGVAASQALKAAVQGRVSASFEDIGTQPMKNIAHPVQVFLVRAGAVAPARRYRFKRPVLAAALAAAVIAASVSGLLWWQDRRAAASAPVSAGAAAERKSVAVLPFANVGDDKANEYFAEGVTDELINLLTRMPGLRVTPRASSFFFKGKSVPVAEAGRLLGVSHLVDGSVRRAGDRVRIGAQLVSTTDGRVLWSRSFDRELKDVLATQSEIALSIGRSLALSLDGTDGRSGPSTDNPAAWSAFLDAGRLPEGERLAAYERVLAMDPRFARAHAAMAQELLDMGLNGKLAKPVAAERMIPHLQEALRIDPRFDEAHGLMGAAARMLDDLELLRRVAQRALDLNPEGAAGHAWMAELKMNEGDMAAALPAYKRMAEALPLVDWARRGYAKALRLANQPAQALQELEQALALNPDSKATLGEKAHNLLVMGRREEGLRLARQHDMVTLLLRFGTPEDQAAVRQRKNLNAHAAAWQQAQLGHPDAMVEHLHAEHSQDIQVRVLVLFDDEYDPVRELPSFKAWLAKYKLTEAHERAQAWRAVNPVPMVAK